MEKLKEQQFASAQASHRRFMPSAPAPAALTNWNQATFKAFINKFSEEAIFLSFESCNGDWYFLPLGLSIRTDESQPRRWQRNA